MGRGLDGFLIFVYWRCVVLKDRVGRSLPVSGGYGEGETPLPFPNRAVKPLSADGTWLERAWESRSPPVYLQRKVARLSGRAARIVSSPSVSVWRLSDQHSAHAVRLTPPRPVGLSLARLP